MEVTDPGPLDFRQPCYCCGEFERRELISWIKFEAGKDFLILLMEKLRLRDRKGLTQDDLPTPSAKIQRETPGSPAPSGTTPPHVPGASGVTFFEGKHGDYPECRNRAFEGMMLGSPDCHRAWATRSRCLKGQSP